MGPLSAEYAQNPRLRGPLENWTHFGQVGSPGEGAFVQIWLLIGGTAQEQGTGNGEREDVECIESLGGAETVGELKIREASYQTHGCMWSMACAGALVQLVACRSAEKALLIQPKDIDLLLGGIPEGKGEYAEMAVCALKRALGDA